MARSSTATRPQAERELGAAQVADLGPQEMSGPRVATRIVVLGGGFGGVTAVRHLERLCGGRRWDRRLRIVLDWTVALFFRPDITKVDIAVGSG